MLYYDCAVQQMWNCVITLVVIVPQKIKSHQTVWCHEIVHENCTAYLMSFSSTLKNVIEWYILLKMNWNVWWFLISLLTLWGAIKCQVFPRTLIIVSHCTGKSFSEALILASINPQYEKDCSLIFQVSMYMKTTSSEQVVYINCFVFVLTFKTIYVHNMFWACSFHVLTW